MKRLSTSNNRQGYVVSSYDFHSTSANINLSNAHNAYLFLKGWFQSTPDLTTDWTHGENAFSFFFVICGRKCGIRIAFISFSQL